MAPTFSTIADPKTVFEIFRNRIGQWCARRADGLVFGTFRERDGALCFARRECRDAGSLKLIF
jgi:hypothetical protein